jgi:hypothetical protein
LRYVKSEPSGHAGPTANKEIVGTYHPVVLLFFLVIGFWQQELARHGPLGERVVGVHDVIMNLHHRI